MEERRSRGPGGPGSAFRVVVAGAGVAGLEALLALHALAADLVDVELLAPAARFTYRPLLVAEPFGVGGATEVDLDPLLEETGTRHHAGALAGVDGARRLARTQEGGELPYDALLVATGARPITAVPGALSFGDTDERRRFAELLARLGRRGEKRLAFVVPPTATWSIAAYELAMLTARERDERRLKDVELVLVTHEARPLEVFGDAASTLVGDRLAAAGVELVVDRAVESFADGALRAADGAEVRADDAVALPALQVPELPGLPQREGGFLPTDVQMHVHGLEDVWAAGDATSFPVKQGGLAAQQADIAARSIAARAGAKVPIQPFHPVLRGILLTGGVPEFMRSGLAASEGGETSSGHALWWPPAKVAGNYLGPYLSRHLTGEPAAQELLEVPPPPESERTEADEERDRALRLVLAAAEADAGREDFEGALRWLGLAEYFRLTLPEEYVVRRAEWRRRLDPPAPLDPAAGRIEPGLVSAEAALSDLQRRLGWLREAEAEEVGEMREELSEFDRGLEHLISLSKRTGNY